MSDLLEEVLRDHSDEKKLYYFKKTLPIVIIFTVLLVTTMLIYNRYQQKTADNKMRMGDILVKTLSDQNDTTLIQESLNTLIAESKNRIGEVAELKQVGLKVSISDYEGAKELLEKIVSQESYSHITTSYARLTWLCLVVDQNTVSETEKARFVDYLQHFTSENQEFFGIVSILKAMWEIKNNKIDAATETIKGVMSAKDLPRALKEQAQALILKTQ